MKENYSETPRTDLAEENLRALGGAGYVRASHARELERELIVKSANYALAHENLGREVLKNGQIETEIKQLLGAGEKLSNTVYVFTRCLSLSLQDRKVLNDARLEWDCVAGNKPFQIRPSASRTPRTDAEITKRCNEFGGSPAVERWVKADLARELEIELNEKNETCNVFMGQVKKLQAALEKARHQLLDRCGIDKDSDNAVALEINKALAEPANGEISGGAKGKL